MGKFRRFCERVFGIDNHSKEEPIIIDGILTNGEKNKEIELGTIDQEKTEDVEKILSGSDVSEFQAHLAELGRTKRTIRDYVYDIKSFANKHSLAMMSATEISEVLDTVGPSAAKRKLAALRAFARFIMDEFGESNLFTEAHRVEVKR